MKRKILFVLLLLGIAGIVDASYLTYEHYVNVIPPCSVNHFLPILSDCGLVLRSAYAVMFGVPLSVLGLIHYMVITLVVGLAILFNKKILWFWIFFQTLIGAIFSIYLVYLQIFVIQSICLYCTLSALSSLLLCILSFFWLSYERKVVTISIMSFVYRHIIKPMFFLIEPESIHTFMLSFGELVGKSKIMKNNITFLIQYKNPKLHQTVCEIEFANPVGLAAGFDYDAQLTQLLTTVGFGFQTVGTITNMPYEGNPKPMLGRLPKSQALMVNKGFKNLGVQYIIRKLKPLTIPIPLGVSIGRTNSPLLKNQQQSIDDIVVAFKTLESSHLKNSFYELNISCPNLIHGGNISFYPSKNLFKLLEALEKIHIQKPVFVKMPIEKSNKEILEMLKIIKDFPFIKGVIFGNLQKDRTDPRLDKEEIKKWKVGYFSGKPCEKRSNELIKLAYQNFGKRFVIIGCGGIFNARDAYRKIKLGASLVQLITGMIYQGPTLIAQINLELIDLLKQDGFNNIKDAVGSQNYF